MLKYILKRLVMLIPVVIGVTLFIFIIMSLAPGDPAMLICGSDAPQEVVEAKREELGLNDPLLLRYGKYMYNIVFHQDFGVSWYNGYNVLSEFGARMPTTLKIGLLSILITAVLGIPIGIFVAVKQYSIFDFTAMVLAMLFSSMPAFWLALMTQLYLALTFKLFPATGADSFAHYVLPAITLSASHMATQVRMTRTSMLDVIKQDYVRTARAKGASETRVVFRHVVRNGLLPVITGIGMSFAMMLGGTVVIENVFAVPGVGSLLINAVKLRDVPVVMGIILVIAVLVGMINLIVDLIYAAIDPRIKFVRNA